MSAAPWSVKGIDPKAREVAKDLARRSGMTLGEWLNSMIMDDVDDDDDVVPLPRRAQADPVYDRRSRSRRMDDAYASDQIWMRLGASVDALAGRLETAEQRSTAAIQGVDQAVAGVLRRLDGQEQVGKTYGRRLEDIGEELKEGHRRLRQFEHDTGPRTVEALKKVEGGIAGVSSRLYDIEERQRTGANELRQRMDALEKTAGSGVGSEALAGVGRRLDEAQGRTTDALRDLERSFAGLDQRLRAAESRVEPEGAREAARFEKMAETLTRQVEANRAEMMLRLNTAETDNRIDRIERAVQSMSEQVRVAEDRSAKAIEAMGREILRIAQNLDHRMSALESGAGGAGVQDAIQALSRKVDADRARFEQKVEQRLAASDDRHAAALEKLGGEITRISDRLSERIAQSERRSAEALEDIGRRLTDSSSRLEQRYDRASGDLADRMRQSEERTAALLSEARDTLQRREPARPAAEAWREPAVSAEPDWRAAAFPGSELFDRPFEDDPVVAEQEAWSADLAAPEPETDAADAAPQTELEEPAFAAQALAGGEAAPPSPPAEPLASTPFGQGFGGADVSDALAATAPDPLDESPDDFDGETEFVDPRALRAAAAQGRASSTRQALEDARAAMGESEAEPAKRSMFGLNRGGKSKLQERLDRQAKGGDTVRKALGASAVAVMLTGGTALAFGELTGQGPQLSDLGVSIGGEAAHPIAALAAAGDATLAKADARGAALYDQARALIDAEDPAGVPTLVRAAEAGSAQAMLHLAGLYQNGEAGVSAEPTQARAWARRAAEAGDARGMHAYGMYLYDGVGGAPDQAQALTWLERAADKGLVDSQFNVAKLYEAGDAGITADPVRAYKWYLIAARANDADAQAAVERLRADLPATVRGEARVEADRFQVAPLA